MSMTMKLSPIPFREWDAKKQDIYYEVDETTTKRDILKFLSTYKKDYLFVKARNGTNYIFQTDLAREMFSVGQVGYSWIFYSLYDSKTGEELKDNLSVADVINMLLKNKSYKEIRGPHASVFLDEYNIEYYLRQADRALKKYGENRMTGSRMTGNQFHEKINEMVDVANQIMNKKLLPNLFDSIPIKKDGTFQSNKKIYLFENGTNSFMDENIYPKPFRLALCIVPHGTWEGYSEYDKSEIVSKYRARLAIVELKILNKSKVLLDRDLSVRSKIK